MNEKATPPVASDLEQARDLLRYPRGYLTHYEAELLTQLAAKFAAIRAEAKAEGWEDAASDLRARAERFCREVAELPDRTSSPEYPDLLLVTVDELYAMLMSEFAAIRAEAKAACPG